MRQGQSSTELMILIGGLIIISVALFYYGAQQITESNKIAKAEDAVDHLAEKANEIASLTTGTRDSVWIELTSRVLDIRFSGRRISLILLRSNGEQYILTRDTLTDIVGKINLTVGLQQLFVTKINDTAVKIGNDPLLLTITPQCISEEDLRNELNITLTGVDFTPLSKPYVQTTPIPSQYINVATITFNANDIYSLINTNPTDLYLQTPPHYISESVCFHIYEPGEFCYCEGGGSVGGEA